MSTEVEIRITELTNEGFFSRFFIGSYWWKSIRMDSFVSKSGFAWSEEDARQKAEKAAKSLVPEPTQTYTLEI